MSRNVFSSLFSLRGGFYALETHFQERNFQSSASEAQKLLPRSEVLPPFLKDHAHFGLVVVALVQAKHHPDYLLMSPHKLVL